MAIAPTRYPVLYRTYSRRTETGDRENWILITDRAIDGYAKVGRLLPAEVELMRSYARRMITLPSGRWLWVGGTPWIDNPINFSGGYNCTSTNIVDWRSFALVMDLAMQGSGTGVVLEPQYIDLLPPVTTPINLEIVGEFGAVAKGDRQELTSMVASGSDGTVLVGGIGWAQTVGGKVCKITVGDSRQGWVRAYESLLEIGAGQHGDFDRVIIDISHVRPAGEPLSGFGGTANPAKLPQVFERVAKILNNAVSRQLTSLECCLLIDEAAVGIVAGGIRRSAGLRHFRHDDLEGSTAKDGLWKQDSGGVWRIDPERDALRVANHTRTFHRKPTEAECIEAVRKQFHSGEGAIQWAGEAVARSNVDLLPTRGDKVAFLKAYEAGKGAEFLRDLVPGIDEKELKHRLERYGLNPCGEITGSGFHCNLAEIHLNQIDPKDLETQRTAFQVAGLSAATLLHHEFQEERYQYSRLVDPIVGVSFTGLFDFFVNAFGVDWLRWWEAGRTNWWLSAELDPRIQEIAHQLGLDPGDYPVIDWDESEQAIETGEYEIADLYRAIEAAYLNLWCDAATQAVWDYCDRSGLRRPNRCTTVQPSGTKSLLTGASPGWHPPKAARFIRRITFRKNDPVALACIDYGYTVVPSQSDKDENGNLLNDPFDPRCTEWLVEIPVAVGWADLPGADTIAIEQFSALAQFDFYMQVQTCYTTHNCFARNTQFLTSEGVKTFESFGVGDTVTVLNADGDWVPATVVNTGDERPMLTITIREGKTGREKTITSTHCHRFPVRRASGGDSKVKIVQCKDLKIGHRLILNSADLPELDEDGIRHGIVFGDGSLYKNSQGEYHKAQLYLCGGKRHLQSYFTDYERTYERDDIDQTRIYGLPMQWKFLPSVYCSQSYVAGFIAGLLATDGNISRSTVSIATGRQTVVDYILDQAPRVGIKVTGFQWFDASGFKQGNGAFQVRFSKATFPENMVLRPHHMEHFRAHESQPCQWRIVDIQDAAPQVGWCVMEPLTNHFTLTDNILVMNTSATIELREPEIEPLARRIHQAIQNDEGYISAALLARFDDLQTFPRLPFEPISRETYETLQQGVLARRVSDDFDALLAQYDGVNEALQGPAPCDGDKCLLPEATK